MPIKYRPPRENTLKTYLNKLGNLGEIDKFLDAKFNQKNKNQKTVRLKSNSFQTKKSPGPDGFTA
jgi:hypothetical protein